jgi:hypothetical protein
MRNTPNRWVVVKIGTEDPIYKVFATWNGGYLDGDSWKMNSGIKSIEEDEESLLFNGYSGSVYHCFKNAYGTNSYSQGVLDDMIKKAKEVYPDKPIAMLPEDTDWINLLT